MGKINSVKKLTDNKFVNLYGVDATSVHNTSALRSFTLAVFSKSRFPAKTQAFFLFSICLQTISKDIPPYFFE